MRQYNIVSDLVLVKPIEPIVYKQFDNGDKLEIELYQDNEKINLSNETVLAFFQLEDINKTVIQKTCSINDGNAIATLDNNILSVSGQVKVEFTVYDGEKETTTRTLLITVESSINRNEAIETVPQWDIVSQIIVEGQGIITAAEQATIDANAAADKANQAALSVEQATQDALTATSIANQAATNADEKALLAEKKSSLADTAAQDAIRAKTATETATQEAQQATEAINLVLPNVLNLEYIAPYNATTQYLKNNIVRLGKNSYIALQDTLGNVPTGTTENQYWGVLAVGGLDGTGSVVTVNGVSPDENGNVTIEIPDPDLSGFATKQELQQVDDNLISHIFDFMPHDSGISQYSRNADVNGVYTDIDFKRSNNTLYMESKLSNPDGDGNYQTVTWQFYEMDGITPAVLVTWSITYDAEGNIVNKVVA